MILGPVAWLIVKNTTGDPTERAREGAALVETAAETAETEFPEAVPGESRPDAQVLERSLHEWVAQTVPSFTLKNPGRPWLDMRYTPVEQRIGEDGTAVVVMRRELWDEGKRLGSSLVEWTLERVGDGWAPLAYRYLEPTPNNEAPDPVMEFEWAEWTLSQDWGPGERPGM
ncbi:MAG: hypothetical protein ACP5I4_11785 [Oceanipulchritudo sp.]